MRGAKRYRIRGAVAAVVAVAGTAAPAHAFYWKGWPAAQSAAARTLIQPSAQGLPGNPPGIAPSGIPGATTPIVPETADLPPLPVGPGPPPEHVPEPATGLVGMLGLATLAAVRWVRRKK